MTTTSSLLSSGAGAAIQFVVCIEGYEYLLTDGAADLAYDTWDGESDPVWAVALGGLTIDWGGMKQSIAPWSTRISPMSITLRVMDFDGTDQFGIDTHANAAGASTKLSADVNTTDAAIDILDNSAFADGVMYIGQERITYTAKPTSNLFTGCARGTLVPFKADSETEQRYARNHRIPSFYNAHEAKISPVVSSTPRNWIGKWVGVWMHVRVGGVLNSKADAQLMFAGTISSIGDSTSGVTLVECTDARAKIQDAVLLHDQMTGTVAEGVTLRDGMVFEAFDVSAGTAKSTSLTCVTGASTSYEVEPGLYTLSELEYVLNTWLHQAKADTSLNFRWSYQAEAATAAGTRGRFTWQHTASSTAKSIAFGGPTHAMTFLGWGSSSGSVNIITSLNTADATWTLDGPEEPYRILLEHPNFYTTMTLANTAGTWVDNTSFLPADLKPFTTTSSSQWGILKLSTGLVLLAHYETATTFTVSAPSKLIELGGESPGDFLLHGLRVSEPGDITVAQVVMLEGKFATLLTQILASTGVTSYNGTYDVLAEQLGCAIPWELLGDAWTQSIAPLGSTQTESICVVLDKPTKLWDVIKSQLILRRASVIWKDEAIRIAQWSTPTATTATWDLTESNKYSPANTVDQQRSPSIIDDGDTCNLLKIGYNRDFGGSYRGSITIIDRAAISDGERAITVNEPSSVGGITATGQSVEALASEAAAWLPMFSRPIRKVRRSIGLEHICTMAPGDQAFITDNFARDPSTGIRGLSAVPALIVSVSWDLGGGSADGGSARDFIAEIDLVLEPGRRFAPYSPCAEVDFTAGSGGYNAGTKTLTMQTHRHSETSQNEDMTHFDAGDKVRVVEIDPASAAAPLTWTDTIASKTTTTCVLTTGLAGWDSTKRYRMISDAYTTAVTTQKSDVYQANDSDGLISSLAQAYVYTYGASTAVTWTASAPSDPPSLPSIYGYGNGYPLDTGYERDCVDLANNLSNYRTAPIGNVLNAVVIAASSGSYQRQILHVMPWHIGPGTFYTRKRRIHVAPFARNTEASGKSIWVYWSRRPPTGSSFTWTTAATPEYTIPTPREYVTFSLSASAGWASLTAQTIDCRAADPDTGEGYLIMEGEKGIETRGYSVLYLGPLENS